MREGEEQEILKGYEGICRGMRQDMDKRSVFKMGWVAVLLALLTAGPSWLPRLSVRYPLPVKFNAGNGALFILKKASI